MAASTTKTEQPNEQAPGVEQYESISLFNERKFRDEVLQLPPNQTEKDIEKELIEEAQTLGLDTSDLLRILSDVPKSREDNQVRDFRFNTADGRTSTAGGSVDTPGTSYPNNEFSSSTVSNSLHSEVSQSTRPTSHGSIESKKPLNAGRSGSRTSIYNWPSSPGLNRPESRNSRRSSFRSAIKGFPNFRKRTSRHGSTSTFSVDSTASVSPSTAVESEADQKVEKEEHQKQTSQDAPQNVPDSEAVKRSWQAPSVQQNRLGHKLERDKYIAFESETMQALSTRHNRIKEEKRKAHEQSEKAISERNMAEANRLEERHIKAEMDLEEELEREKQSLEICIRHMEGYFNTPSLPPASEKDSQQSPRRFTQKQRDALHQKYKEQQSIDALHASRIKVLRDRQERKIQEVVRRMEGNVEELCETNKRHYRDLEKRCEDERISALLWLESKQRKLRAKWILEETILRKRLETQTGETYGPLPEIAFEPGQ